MTLLSTTRSPSSPGPSSARRRTAAVDHRATGRRRRWGRVGIGAAMVVVGAWVFAGLYLSAGDRREVLVLDRDVDVHEVLERSDVRVARASVDPGVEVVAADDLGRVVGRPARTRLVAGSLLVEGQLGDRGDDGLDPGEAVVSMVVGPGEAPTSALRPGARVAVVLRPPAGQEGELVQVSGRVLDQSDGDRGDATVELVVDEDDAGTVSAAAADERATVVALAEEP